MNSLSMDEILQARLKELEMSPYQIAQAIAGDDGNPKAYTNRVGNTLTDPKNRKFCSVEEVVKILIFQLKQKLYAFYGDELSSLVFSTPDPNSFQSYKVQTQNSII